MVIVVCLGCGSGDCSGDGDGDGDADSDADGDPLVITFFDKNRNTQWPCSCINTTVLSRIKTF